jgi:hypothetical protein
LPSLHVPTAELTFNVWLSAIQVLAGGTLQVTWAQRSTMQWSFSQPNGQGISIIV